MTGQECTPLYMIIFHRLNWEFLAAYLRTNIETGNSNALLFVFGFLPPPMIFLGVVERSYQIVPIEPSSPLYICLIDLT